MTPPAAHCDLEAARRTPSQATPPAKHCRQQSWKRCCSGCGRAGVSYATATGGWPGCAQRAEQCFVFLCVSASRPPLCLAYIKYPKTLPTSLPHFLLYFIRSMICGISPFHFHQMSTSNKILHCMVPHEGAPVMQELRDYMTECHPPGILRFGSNDRESVSPDPSTVIK